MSEPEKWTNIIIPRGPLGFEFSIKSSGPLIVISQVRARGTAELAGLQVGSILKAVNKQPIDGLTFLQVSNMIRRSSGLTTELTVAAPEETASAITYSDSITNGGNVDLRHATSVRASSNAPGSSSDCENAAPTTRRPRLLAFMDQIKQHQQEEAVALAQAPSSNDVQIHSRQHVSDNGLAHCRLRRQAVLFSKDTAYVAEPPDFSPSQLFSSSGDQVVSENSLDNVISSFPLLKLSDRERADGKGDEEISPAPLVLQQTCPTVLSSPLAINTGPVSFLARSKSVKTTEDAGPRFLPAYTSPTLSREEFPQPTFLPKLSIRRKSSSPTLLLKPSPSNEPKFTNLAAYMDGLTVPINSVNRSLIPSNGVIQPSHSYLPDNDLIRPSDRIPYSKVGALPTQTTETDQKPRFKILKSPTESTDLHLDFYKSPLCLCKVIKVDGKAATPVAWRCFNIYIGGGFIRFLLASDFHNFSQNASGFPLSAVDPFTLEGFSTSKCIILPTTGLQWSNKLNLPSDVPTWDTLSPVFTSFRHHHHHHPQPSEMVESDSTNDLPCYIFEHESNGGTEIAVIFPDAQTLTNTLNLCQRLGGVCRENDPISKTTVLSSQSTKQTPQHVEIPLHRGRKSLPDTTIHRRIAAEAVAGIKRIRDRSLDRDEDQPQGSQIPQRSTGVEDASKFRFFSTTAAPFFKGIANVIYSARTAVPTTAANADTLPMGPLSAEEVSRRVAAALGDPPDFGDLNQPGPVFGAPLEKQVPSPDYPNVPLVLHTTVHALERHGLHHVGLYRAPGRQKEINRFVCLANLTSLDPKVMLSLTTWNDVRALTGIIKVFFRRLPQPICDSDSWKSLACLISEESDELDESSLVYILQAIRAKLNKIRSTSYLPLNTSTMEHGTSVVSWRWRYATLDYLFTHLRRIISLEAANQCSFKCIAICFGPSLFNADNNLQNKFNVLLEVMLQHWHWLTADESGPPKADSDANSHQKCASLLRNTTVSETEAYVKHYFKDGNNFEDLSLYKLPPQDPTKTLDVRATVKDIFERAGFEVSTRESLDQLSDNGREEEHEESLLNAIMRSLPQPSDDHPSENWNTDVDRNKIHASGVPQRTDF